MLNAIIRFSVEHRFVVLVTALLLAVAGGISLAHLPLDAFPDVTPVQVQINTTTPALGPLEVEQQITLPVERALGGLPELELIRSISKFGLSQVVAVFRDGTNIYFARQVILERLQSVELPGGLQRPELGPVATGLGEVFHYRMRGEGHSLTDLTTQHNGVLKPQLETVRGVAEVNTWGGLVKQYQVRIQPDRLIKHGLSFQDVFEAVERNNRNAGGGLLTLREGESFLVHGLGLAASLQDIAGMVIHSEDGSPIYLRDVARIEVGHETRRGVVTAGGRGETVLGLGFMLMGENSRTFTRRFRDKLETAQKSLPQGMTVEVLYNRTDLVEKVLSTVLRNLLEGALLVVAVLFAFLGRLRAGLIVALAIPLSMLCAFSAMLQAGIAGSLMSLGAIDFGLIVDSSVIQIENSVRRLAENQEGRPAAEVIRDAAIEVRKPTLFGELIILIVYLPILTLEGVEGKLFRPMALTVTFALLGSLVLSLTVMPAMASLLLPARPQDREPGIVCLLQWAYRPLLRLALQFRVAMVLAAAACLALAAGVAVRLGSEFVPKLQEGALVANIVRLAGVSVEESARYGSRIERILLDAFPDEIEKVWTRTGTAEVATDPMGLEVSDIFMTLRPREAWRRARTYEELTLLVSRRLQALPGMRAAFSQPIEMRVNELVAGIRTDLGVKVYGDDLGTLKAIAARVEQILRQVPGAADPSTEQLTGQPVLVLRTRPDEMARHGVSVSDVMDVVECLGGRRLGEVREGPLRFNIMARLDTELERSPDRIGSILLPATGGQRIPLHRVARIEVSEEPAVINREWGRRRIAVTCNVRGRDVGSFVAEARARIDREIQLPAGTSIGYGGQFENLERGQQRLLLVVPLALLLVFTLLYATYGRVLDAARVFLGVPFAAVGGVFALWLRDLPFSISAGVGFIALSGVAVLGEMVLVSTVRQLLARGMPLSQAIRAAAERRLRPVLMTGLVASLGFVPMALSTGVGAEVQRPLATVVIGGVLSSTAVTLLLLPVLYSLFGSGGRPVTEEEAL
ncbi:MAG: efflux RND transporter permease subunit [Planctomycetes bacterium]|nr:efflux RND transporter permease subunit [Planctomycetota bacterium]